MDIYLESVNAPGCWGHSMSTYGMCKMRCRWEHPSGICRRQLAMLMCNRFQSLRRGLWSFLIDCYRMNDRGCWNVALKERWWHRSGDIPKNRFKYTLLNCWEWWDGFNGMKTESSFINVRGKSFVGLVDGVRVYLLRIQSVPIVLFWYRWLWVQLDTYMGFICIMVSITWYYTLPIRYLLERLTIF